MRQYLGEKRALLIIALTLVTVTALSATVCAYRSTPDEQRSPKYRWVFIHSQLPVAGWTDRMESLMRRAAAVGCNGVVWAEASLGRSGPIMDEERQRVRRIRELARELGIELIPTVFAPSTLLSQDPNLAEGIPVRDVLFIARGDVAKHKPDPPVQLDNGGFEGAKDGRPTGWTVELRGNATVRLDRNTPHAGEKSLVIEVGSGQGTGGATLRQNVQVSPWRQYHLSVWVRTSRFRDGTALQPWAIGRDGRPLNYSRWSLPENSPEWIERHAVFNSQDNRSVEIRLGAHEMQGSVWIDSVRLEEVALVNLIRRDGCPLKVRGEDGVIYTEGDDFEPVAADDARTIARRGGRRPYHVPPEGIRLKPRGRITEGTRLRVSYYAVPVIFETRITECLTDPRAFELRRQEVRRVHELVTPQTWMMSHDEMRVMNWCETCRRKQKTPGQLLADNVRACAELIREVNPEARIAVWSDMFDPHHNCRDNYYFVNGPLAGSAEGLARDVLIVNWNHQATRASLRWFAQRGHRQIFAGYYDQDMTRVREKLAEIRDEPSLDGSMFTTWKREYRDLEAFARAAW